MPADSRSIDIWNSSAKEEDEAYKGYANVVQEVSKQARMKISPSRHLVDHGW